VLGVRPALAHPNVMLVTRAEAVRLETDPAGTAVTEVIVRRDGEREAYRGAIVVVACGAVNSARLLLMSANDRHPRGLANGSDQVGRNYMFHNSAAVLALSREPNPTRYQKTLGVNDFYFGAPGFDYPMGSIQMMGKSLAPMYRGEKPIETALTPRWLLDDVARHAVDFWLTTEDLPDPHNRVSVDEDGRVTLRYTPNNRAPARKLYEALRAMLGRLRMHPDTLIPHRAYLKSDIPIAGVAHQAGT
jgi:choline dehydrogenase-like flavoprotein